MKRIIILNILMLVFLTLVIGQNIEESRSSAQVNKIVLDSSDQAYGYYMYSKPNSNQIKAILLLLPGYGQKSEQVFSDTRLPFVAAQENMMTVAFAGRTKMYADSLIQHKINAVLIDVIQRFDLANIPLIIGGFSAGGSIGLRYAELCKEFPNKFPLSPKAVFMADAPVELFKIYELAELNYKNKYSDVSVQEARWIMKFFKDDFGIPSENKSVYAELSPFCMDKSLCENEIHLKDVAVRAYHDVDIAWRLKNRNQSVKHLNFTFTSELINRLLLLGNEDAEFIQSFETGYRSNGERHPHSWSIIDEEECIQWMNSILSK